MQRNERRADEDWAFGPGPFVVSGRPPLLEGVIELINKAEREQELTALPLSKLVVHGHRGALPDAVTTFVRLGPHGRTPAAVQLTLDPATPPGRYEAELSLGGQTERLLIEVLENWEIRVVPEAISVVAAPGEKLNRHAVIINLGNVEIELPARRPVAVDLEDDAGLLQLASVAAREVGKEGFNKFLDRLVQDWAEHAVGPAVLHLRSRGRRIQPGERREIELDLQLPEDLKRGRIYTGKFRIKNTSVMTLEIDCSRE